MTLSFVEQIFILKSVLSVLMRIPVSRVKEKLNYKTSCHIFFQETQVIEGPDGVRYIIAGAGEELQVIESTQMQIDGQVRDNTAGE